MLLGLLFKTAAEVLQCFAKDPQWRLGGKLGLIAVLHTWSQTLINHFHLHCLVPAGALSFDERQWISARSKYLCIALIRKLIDPSAVPIEKIEETPAEMMLRLTGVDITCCPQCNKGKMVATILLSKMSAAVG